MVTWPDWETAGMAACGTRLVHAQTFLDALACSEAFTDAGASSGPTPTSASRRLSSGNSLS